MAANPTFSNKTYAGEFFDELFGPVVLDPAGLEDAGLATAIDRSKFKETIYEGDDTVELQDASPDYTSQSSTANIDEVNLDLVAYDFNKTISLNEIRQSWYSSKLAAGSLNDYTYDELVDMYINNIYVPKLKQAQDNLVINGKTGLDATVGSYSFSATYNGLYSLFNASSALNKVSIAADSINIATVVKGTTTVLNVASDAKDSLAVNNIMSIRGAAGTGWSAINGDFAVIAITATTITIALDTSALTSGDYTGTSASIQFINALNIIKKVVAHVRSLPVQVRRNGVRIAIPAHLEMEWQFANSEVQQNGGAYYQRSYGLNLNEVQLIVLDNAPANTLGSWDASRVFYGYDLSDDYSNVQVLWQGDTTGDKVYRVLGKMKTGVAITTKFQNEITLSTPDA
jgi:hypothetical protein